MLARWQAEPCRLLLLDEPFQGVDVGARADLIAAIRGGQQDSATLIATSDAEEALEVADRIFVMRDHTLVGSGDAAPPRLPFSPRSTRSRRPSFRRPIHERGFPGRGGARSGRRGAAIAVDRPQVRPVRAARR